MINNIVVIGAGQSGTSLAFKLRHLGYEGKITIIGSEPVLPYQRPPLSKKYLVGAVSKEDLFLKPEDLFRKNNIEMVLGKTVDYIDRKEKHVALCDGLKLPFDYLALTTGSSPVTLPESVGGGLANVFCFRTLGDADKLSQELMPDRNLLVIGGGYIGLEAAAIARSLGMNVYVVELSERILKRVASKETSDYFRNLHLNNGVQILENCGLKKLEEEDGRAVRAVLTNGETLTISAAVVGIGVRPVTDLAEKAGIAVENGIIVNEFGRTSDPNIFAAGDCTSFPYLQRSIRLESVQNAIEQAENAAENMLGKATPYRPIPWFWSDQYSAKLKIAGLNQGYDKVICRPGNREGGLSVWYFRDNSFLAVDAINDAKAFMLGKKWLQSGHLPKPEEIADFSSDLSSLL